MRKMLIVLTFALFQTACMKEASHLKVYLEVGTSYDLVPDGPATAPQAFAPGGLVIEGDELRADLQHAPEFGAGVAPTTETATPPWNAVDLDWLHSGVRLWRADDFDIRPYGEKPDPSDVELPLGVVDYPTAIDGVDTERSYITVQIYRDKYLQQEGKYAGLHQVDSRVIFINAGITSDYLSSVAAHEVGHLLSHAGHTAPGVKAIMSASWTTDDLTQADNDYICASSAARCEHDFN